MVELGLVYRLIVGLEIILCAQLASFFSGFVIWQGCFILLLIFLYYINLLVVEECMAVGEKYFHLRILLI